MTVVTEYNVRSGALASSKIAGLTFVDPRIPRKYWPYLVTHEQVEKKKMAKYIKAGMTKKAAYLKAHTEDATPAERAHVERDGGNWRHYTAEMDGYLDHIEHEKIENPPLEGHVDPDMAVDAGHDKSHNKHQHQEISAALIQLAADGLVYDTDRIMFLRSYLTQLQRATLVPASPEFLGAILMHYAGSVTGRVRSPWLHSCDEQRARGSTAFLKGTASSTIRLALRGPWPQPARCHHR
jgi:hypothetical protein